VITGAGSGLGKAMATAFARQGMNIVMAGMHRERLERLPLM
jgi:NADP-dependent 3-hydroxy acid dehydrogenase YdfG